ncbi:hypothetical protein EG328_001372 [Venturia inaequalis]|uniref:Uncharacterized protein n=1 Tax=Venturia inaequalis TaxID=5025 RepID=A0A8H3Z1I7_VENIN|nr:hypothetical protein EG328_001372 [Venturia inaequalis]KAE9982270.1 hypothetical protein EG327_005902 [Venturia inaequalis]RDI88495.1 hypothetical protein Vi05172_g1410 [Venturia inaequalis]
MDTPTLSSRAPKRRKTSPSKSVPPENTTTPRASFLSPTRASLSRFNPSLLPRPTSAGNAIARRNPQTAPQTPDTTNAFLTTGQDALNFIMGSIGGTMQQVLSSTRQQPQNSMIPTVLTGDETDEQMAAIRAANKARKQIEKRQEEAEDRQRRASERRSMVPIEQARGDSEDGFDAPEMESALPEVDDVYDEDDLPDTPEQIRRQLELDSSPPRELPFSSPSRRRRRLPTVRRELPERPAQIAKEARPPDSDTAEPEPENDHVPEIETLPEMEPQSHSVQQKMPETTAKEVEKGNLEKELRLLQDEVQRYRRHVDRFDSERDEDIEDLVQLINSSKPGAPHVDRKPTPLSSLLTSFLPFSIPGQQSEPPLDQDKAIPSHLPVPQSDPMPLLTLFTPLKFTSIISPPSKSASRDDVLQTHHITLKGPSSLLACDLDLTISSSTEEGEAPRVGSLVLSNISPWASVEAGPFLQKRAAEGDVNTIGYALARYWDISMKRAQCWSRCCKEFRHLLALSKELQSTIEEEEVSTLDIAKPSKRELLPHLGRQFLSFETKSVVLRIEWKLCFDWTGEVESIVSAKAALPRVWHEADTSDSLEKIETTFDILVAERGVFDAVRIIIGLLFQDDE